MVLSLNGGDSGVTCTSNNRTSYSSTNIESLHEVVKGFSRKETSSYH